eukprot:scaffold1525_cov142-Cylindrotheca_fusiformis.AAC.98
MTDIRSPSKPNMVDNRPAIEPIATTSPIMAQRYNNRAVCCIEAGKFDLAIRYFTKALRISSTLEEKNQPFCACESCSLQCSLAYSYARSAITKNQNGNEEEGFIYKSPMRVSPHSMNHFLGPTFSLSVTFNMALAHQLSAMEEDKESARRCKLRKALKLYELAYRWLLEESVDCLPFAMVIANNLAEVHRAAKNHEKCQKCLQNLLSTMMYLLIVDTDLESVGAVDGFFQNIAPLIIRGQCAGAA